MKSWKKKSILKIVLWCKYVFNFFLKNVTRDIDVAEKKTLIYGQTLKKKKKNCPVKKSYRKQIKKKNIITNDINIEW
jgi:hypothetical protein